MLGRYLPSNVKYAVKSGISALDLTMPAGVILHHQTQTNNPKKQNHENNKIFLSPQLRNDL